MSGFDVGIVAIVAVSAVLAFARGIVRSLIGLLAWVAGFVAALVFAPAVAAMFAPDSVLAYAIAFIALFIVVLVVGALIAWPLRTVIHKAGLGFVDRGLGFVFGIARGVVVVLAFVVIGGLAGWAQRDWWQNSVLVAPFEQAALSLRSWLPPAWAERLRFRERANEGQKA